MHKIFEAELFSDQLFSFIYLPQNALVYKITTKNFLAQTIPFCISNWSLFLSLY